jgi:two-component system, OmpR family, response regulator
MGETREARILVVDDDPSITRLLSMALRYEGFEVATACAHEATAAAEAFQPDLVLAGRPRALSVGSDDTVAKPFRLEELVAHIRAVLRRRADGRRPRELVLGDLVLDEDAHRASRRGEPLDLTPTEFRLLRYLLLNAGTVVSKARILEHVWNADFGGSDNIVETYVSYLRRKVDRHHPPLIHTVRRLGYTLRYKGSADGD